MKRLVIIGGGFAGALVAKELQRKFDVALIDDKDHFEFTPGILRILAEPERSKKLMIRHRSYLKKGKIFVGKVQEVTEKEVVIGRTRIGYDYLVVTSGSYYRNPLGGKAIIPTRGAAIKEAEKRLHKSKSVLIIGGGLVGVELAGEICNHFKDMEVRIVHAGTRLLERNSLRAGEVAARYLEKKGVKFVYGEKIVSANGKTFMTDGHTKLKADVCFSCAGVGVDANFMKRHFSKFVNEKGALVVNDKLQITENIFAAGDVTNIVEEKTAQAAEKQAEVIIANLLATESNSKLESYKPKKRPLLISIGKWYCIFEGSFVMSGLIPAFMKMFVEWKTLANYRG